MFLKYKTKSVCIGGSTALVCNKKQEGLGKDKSLWFEQEQLLRHYYSLISFLLPQLDYTEAGTCNKCFEKRKNVSLAAEPCSCVVMFDVNKRLKVKRRFGQRFEPLILHQTQTSLFTDAFAPGRRLLLLRPPKLSPEPPQIHGFQGRHPVGRQNEKLKGSSHKISCCSSAPFCPV